MSIYYKPIFCLLGLVLFLNSSSEVLGQRKSKNKSQTDIAAKQADVDAKRKKFEAMMLQGEYQHDGSGELIYIGTIDSVPALLKVLENHPPSIYDPCGWSSGIEIPPPPPALKIPPPPPPLKNGSLPPSLPPDEVSNLPQIEVSKPDCSPKKSYICTYAHAVSALRKITGQNFFEYQDWKNWWEKYQVETKSQKLK